MDTRHAASAPPPHCSVNGIPMLTLKEVHQEIPLLSVDSLRRMIRRGELLALKVGSGHGRIFVPATEVARIQLALTEKLSPKMAADLALVR